MPTKKDTNKPSSDGSISFELSIPWKDIHDHYLIHLQETAKTTEIKGFRKGKAPIAIIEKTVDKPHMLTHALEHIFPTFYAKELASKKLSPVIEPRVTLLKTTEGKPWKIKVETVVKPKVKLGNYKTYISKAIKTVKPPKKSKKTTKSLPQATTLKDLQLQATFTALLKNSKVEIAQLLIDEETKSALSRLINQLKPLKLSVDDYIKSIKKTKAELVEEYEKTANNNLRLEFALDAIILKENPTVTEKEIEKLNPKDNEREYAKYSIKKRKVIDKLLEL